LEAAQEVIKPNSRRYLDIVDAIQSSHLQAIREASLRNPEIQENVEKSVIHECERLLSFMAAAEVRFCASCIWRIELKMPE
jgi:aspartate kinase